jgi:glutamate racemase
MGPEVQIISSDTENAHEVKAHLKRLRQLAPETATPTYEFYTTGDTDTFRRLGSRIFGADLHEVEKLKLLNGRGIGLRPMSRPNPRGTSN